MYAIWWLYVGMGDGDGQVIKNFGMGVLCMKMVGL